MHIKYLEDDYMPEGVEQTRHYRDVSDMLVRVYDLDKRVAVLENTARAQDVRLNVISKTVELIREEQKELGTKLSVELAKLFKTLFETLNEHVVDDQRRQLNIAGVTILTLIGVMTTLIELFFR